ncbi:MAG: tRNA modification GTPase [Planctomycetes bacterium]|nr:tRNA modification GTPase [Planctomycetota bacterium]
MLPDPADTIVALSSAPGPGARAIVRLSGSQAFAVTAQLCNDLVDATMQDRSVRQVNVTLPGVTSPLPAEIYLWRSPRTYTGQDLAEIHTLSCPPLLELLIARFLDLGARAAQAGEFTMRAFLAGKLYLTQVEALVGVIEATDRTELQQALIQLAGGASRPLQQLREDLLNLLADVEAGLDFSEEDIRFVEQCQLLDRVAHALAHVTLVRKQIDQRSLAAKPFRVVLTGMPNAGKSMLFNALLGRQAALVSAHSGTTRDYLEGILRIDNASFQLVDIAGIAAGADSIAAEAQMLGREQMETADLILYCRAAESADEDDDVPTTMGRACVDRLLRVATKCDLKPARTGWMSTSAVTRQGLAELKKTLADKARSKKQPPLAPSLSRCRHHVEACLSHLRQAHGLVLNEDPVELLAVELRGALEELGAMVGAVYTDDLLDRIFSRFCIGK